MSWQTTAGMGTNAGNGVGGGGGGGEMGMQGNGSNQPHATEYTLQGVMRFLQTEWHRHERDRNSWEIERQEMKARIATLEGQARRADATQKALKKYVAILQSKVKEQSANKATSPDDAAAEAAAKEDRAAMIKEKLKASEKKISDTGADPETMDDEAQRKELKAFLDHCQSEFMYLMITPANPLPPRESPPLPMMEDIREAQGNLASMPNMQLPSRPAQNHIQDMMAGRPPPAPNHAPPMQSLATNLPPRHNDSQPTPLSRSTVENSQMMYGDGAEWPAANVRGPQDSMARQNHVAERPADREGTEMTTKNEAIDTDAWDLDFPDPGTTQPPQRAGNRPDTDVFPNAENLPKSPSRAAGPHRRKGSMSRRRSSDHELSLNSGQQKPESGGFGLKFGLRGHLNTVRTVIFSGGGSPGEPEICTAGDDGTVKRFHIPRVDGIPNPNGNSAFDLDVQANFTHRGHSGAVLCLTSWSPSPNFSTGGRAQGDGWIFSGGQDASIRVWERGRVDPKATLSGHTDAVWALCVLPATLGSVFGNSSAFGSPDRILLASGAADGTVRLWSVSAPPQLTSPQPGSNRRMPGSGGRVRGNSMSSGSQFPASPQPTTASNSPFHQSLLHTINRQDGSTASPTCITPLSPSGESFVVSYSDAAIIVYDTRTGEQISNMDSLETYDGTMDTSVNTVVATTVGFEQPLQGGGGAVEEDSMRASGGPTGGGRSMGGSGVEGTIISGHEDRFVRFYDANSGQCTYNMVAHPAAISSVSLSPDGRELVTAGHDGSLRFWSMEKRSCTQEISGNRIMRGEGVCSVVWSQDGKWVVSGGGDGIVKVFAKPHA